jgi:GNAT superfamily N-acetyltransferase
MLTIKTMSPSELEIAVEWAAAEGWNPGLSDASCYYQADPNGFFIGYLGDKPIACISAVRYSDDFGFMGFYIVAPEHRGKGYGIAIWNAAIQYLDGCNIALDGVVEQQENYKKSGFTYAHANYRYETRASSSAPRNPDMIPLSHIPKAMILRYSDDFFPAGRQQFLESWIQQSGAISYGFMEHGQLVGYAFARPCREGFKIGPLFANSPEIAEDLFTTLKAKVPEASPIYLDIPERNSAALQLVERHSMHLVFETARMYTGEEPEISLERTYGITSFEIG